MFRPWFIWGAIIAAALLMGGGFWAYQLGGRSTGEVPEAAPPAQEQAVPSSTPERMEEVQAISRQCPEGEEYLEMPAFIWEPGSTSTHKNYTCGKLTALPAVASSSEVARRFGVNWLALQKGGKNVPISVTDDDIPNSSYMFNVAFLEVSWSDDESKMFDVSELLDKELRSMELVRATLYEYVYDRIGVGDSIWGSFNLVTPADPPEVRELSLFRIERDGTFRTYRLTYPDETDLNLLRNMIVYTRYERGNPSSSLVLKIRDLESGEELDVERWDKSRVDELYGSYFLYTHGNMGELRDLPSVNPRWEGSDILYFDLDTLTTSTYKVY